MENAEAFFRRAMASGDPEAAANSQQWLGGMEHGL